MNIGFGLLLAFLAGLSTIIGSLLAIFFKRPDERFLSFSLGFSAGVMIFISFMELLPQAIKNVTYYPALIAFFAGITIMFILDNYIPHDYMAEHHLTEGKRQSRNLGRTGLFIALGIAIHNFPEGLAVFAGTVYNLHLGIVLAVAIALHNIPEGLAVSIPVYAATGSRRKAFLWAFYSGMVEPLAALIALVFLLPFLNIAVIGFLLAVVAGIMVFISIDELVPISCAYGGEHIGILGFILGMIIMAVSICMMGC